MPIVKKNPATQKKQRVIRIAPLLPEYEQSLRKIKKRHFETIQSGSSSLEKLLQILFKRSRLGEGGR